MVALNETSNTDKKRARVDSDNSSDMPESKRVRVEGTESEVLNREDILEILSDSDCDPVSQDLDSVIKSLQDEISQPEMTTSTTTTTTMTSNSGESQPELGYLLEASDYELGIPPATSSPSAVTGDEGSVTSFAGNAECYGEMLGLGFEDEFPSYDSLGLGLGFGLAEDETVSGDFVAIDGLFDYGGSEPSGLLWQPESLPAV